MAARSPAPARRAPQRHRRGAPKLPRKGALLFAMASKLTVRGSYLDMVDYMAALEALPTQLFWGRAQLEVEPTRACA
jgi:MSHA biogenesis protein MshJ